MGRRPCRAEGKAASSCRSSVFEVMLVPRLRPCNGKQLHELCTIDKQKGEGTTKNEAKKKEDMDNESKWDKNRDGAVIGRGGM
jgi:hypothetical protein